MSVEQLGGGEVVRRHRDPTDPTTWLRQLRNRSPSSRFLAGLCSGIREKIYGPEAEIDPKELEPTRGGQLLKFPELVDEETSDVLRELVILKPRLAGAVEVDYFITTAPRSYESTALLHLPHGIEGDRTRWLIDFDRTASLVGENPIKLGATKATREQIGFMAARLIEALILSPLNTSSDAGVARVEIEAARQDFAARRLAARAIR